MSVSITSIYPPANRPGQQRNESYENSLRVAQGTLNAIIGTVGKADLLTADPVTPDEGVFWFRTDTFQLCIMVNGTIRRSGVFT